MPPLPPPLAFECNPPGNTWVVLRSHSSYNVVFCPGYFSSSLSSYPVLFLESSELLVSYTTLVLLSLLWLSNKFKIAQILNIQLQGFPSIFFALQSVNSEFPCYHRLNKKSYNFLSRIETIKVNFNWQSLTMYSTWHDLLLDIRIWRSGAWKLLAVLHYNNIIVILTLQHHLKIHIQILQTDLYTFLLRTVERIWFKIKAFSLW